MSRAKDPDLLKGEAQRRTLKQEAARRRFDTLCRLHALGGMSFSARVRANNLNRDTFARELTQRGVCRNPNDDGNRCTKCPGCRAKEGTT